MSGPKQFFTLRHGIAEFRIPVIEESLIRHVLGNGVAFRQDTQGLCLLSMCRRRHLLFEIEGALKWQTFIVFDILIVPLDIRITKAWTIHENILRSLYFIRTFRRHFMEECGRITSRWFSNDLSSWWTSETLRWYWRELRGGNFNLIKIHNRDFVALFLIHWNWFRCWRLERSWRLFRRS